MTLASALRLGHCGLLRALVVSWRVLGFVNLVSGERRTARGMAFPVRVRTKLSRLKSRWAPLWCRLPACFSVARGAGRMPAPQELRVLTQTLPGRPAQGCEEP